MQNPLSLLGLVKLCFLCCKLACIVPSTLTQLTFAPPQIQHIFQSKIHLCLSKILWSREIPSFIGSIIAICFNFLSSLFHPIFYNINLFGILILALLFYLLQKKKHFPNVCPCHGPMASVYPHRLIIGYSGKRFQSAKKKYCIFYRMWRFFIFWS